MKREPTNRLRIGMATLPIGGVIGLVGILMRGPHGTPMAAPERWAEVASSTSFTIAQFAILVGYVGPFLGFWALYSHLRQFDVERPAFWGFLLSIWGTTLALPALGIAAFAGPAAATLFLEGETGAADLITDALTGSGFYVGIIAAICYSAGPLLSSYAISKTRKVSRLVALLFGFHGLLLSFGFSFYPLLIAGWIFLIVSGFWLAAGFRS